MFKYFVDDSAFEVYHDVSYKGVDMFNLEKLFCKHNDQLQGTVEVPEEYIDKDFVYAISVYRCSKCGKIKLDKGCHFKGGVKHFLRHLTVE